MYHHRIGILLVIFISLSCLAGPRAAKGAGHVRFTFHAPAARQVFLAGTFNRWDPSQHVMTGPDGKGDWTISLTLPPGRYEYLFVINGTQWAPDPAASWTDDGYGGRNSVLVVPGKGDR